MDAAVSTRYETFLRPEDKRWDGWVQAQGEKIRRSLANPSRHTWRSSPRPSTSPPSAWPVHWATDLRQPQFGWREQQPGLATWYADVTKRPSMAATAPVI